MGKNRWQLLVLLAGTFGFATVAAAGGDGASGKKSYGQSAEERGTGSASSAMSKAPSKELTDGLEKLHAANQAEIQSGQLAQQSATSPDVKAFGEKMVTDHSAADQKLTSIARSMGVNLEGKTFQKEQKDARKTLQTLQEKSGADFDEEYVSRMVEDHEKNSKAARQLAEEARKDDHAELASFLSRTAQGMQGHLAHAKQLEETARTASTPSTEGGSSEEPTGTGTGASEEATGTGSSQEDLSTPSPDDLSPPSQDDMSGPSQDGTTTGTSPDGG